MSRKHRLATACAAAVLMTASSIEVVRGQRPARANGADDAGDGPLARAVREATANLRDTGSAEASGYVLSSGCVSGPEEGAMGVHFGNAALLGDGQVNVNQPDVLVFEPRDGTLQLAAAEYVVLAEAWDAGNDHPPVLHGQHFHYVSAPNRSGLPAHYELHVWAWRRNPHGTFADWNPEVSCESYVTG